MKRLKKNLLPYIAPLLYYPKYLRLLKQIDTCFEQQYDVFCFFPAYHIGGAEKVHAQILQALKQFRVATFITHKSKSDAFKETYKAASKSFIDIAATGNYVFFQKRLAEHLANKLNSVTYSCTLFGCNAVLFYLLLPLIKNEKIKKVDLLHAFAPYIRGIEHTSIHYVQWIDTRIVINKKTREDYRIQYKEHLVNENLLDRIQIIYNALDAQCLPKEKDFSFPLKCLFVGRGTSEKRFSIFLAVAAECRNRQLPIEFTAVGDLEDYKHINRNVLFRGEIKNESKLKKIYEAHHLLLITSIYEGFPLTIMEAMCNGLVSISTDVGGIPEHIYPYKNGFLIKNQASEKKIVEDITALFIHLSETPEQVAEISVNSIQYAQQNFNLENFKRSYIEVLIR